VSPLALLTPLPLKIAVDSVLGSADLPGFLRVIVPGGRPHSRTMILAIAVGLLILIAALKQLCDLANTLLTMYTGEKLVLAFRARLFRHVQRLSLGYHDTKGTADSIYRIQNDAIAIQHIAIDGIIPFITAILTLAGMMYVTVQIDWQLAVIALTIAPALMLLTQVSRRTIRERWREVKKLESSALSVVQEVLGAVRVVKAFGQEEREQRRFVHQSRAGVSARLRFFLYQGVFDLLTGLIIALGTAAVLFTGVRHVQSGTLSLGNLLLVVGYLSQLYAPLETIGQQVTSLQGHFASAERAYALLDEAPDVAEQLDALPLARATGAISFCEVRFAYAGNRPVVQEITFDVKPGTRVGIVGTTGAGKSTLMSLLTRFSDPDAGHILLDGVDLRDYNLADLRNQFAIVLQEPVLFSTSIAENIAYARPDASTEDIIAAARAANIHDVISRLPEGYDTVVGERGMRLSGGERQRISLARAFLKDAPILILDEPTSSVDVKTEATIMEAMERLMRNRTTFMIAHRLSTLANCDVLLQIEQGRLVATTYRSHAEMASSPAR